MSSVYDRSVFINCPFDKDYSPIFEALAFTVLYVGFFPRCAKEFANFNNVRNQAILGLIKECRFGIHDLSRTELNAHGLPRFNMPLELGYFLGAQHFGSGKQKAKFCLVMDREKYRYMQFVSDLSGQDIKDHSNDVGRVIRIVREWLKKAIPEANVVGAKRIHDAYLKFRSERGPVLEALQLDEDDLECFPDFINVVESWVLLYG